MASVRETLALTVPVLFSTMVYNKLSPGWAVGQVTVLVEVLRFGCPSEVGVGVGVGVGMTAG
jgi:hypothetical protein